MEVKSRFKKFIEKFSFNKEKILVTGGLGYIGSHTVVELIESGFDVIVVDNLSNSNIDVLKGIEKITGSKPKFENIDCSDYVAMDKFLSKNEGIQAIIHFAALKAVGDSVKRPLPYYRNNIGSMIALLELMQVHKIPNMVFSSSCTVYGQADKMPVSENTPIKIAQSPYGNTKQICEEIITDALAANDSLKAVVLRYFNPIGAHPSSYIGEQPNGVPENLVPYIVQTAAGIRKKRLQDPRRHLYPRLYQRSRFGTSPYSSSQTPTRRQSGEQRDIQPRNRRRYIGTGADKQIRAGNRCQGALRHRRQTCGRHRSYLGRPAKSQ